MTGVLAVTSCTTVANGDDTGLASADQGDGADDAGGGTGGTTSPSATGSSTDTGAPDPSSTTDPVLDVGNDTDDPPSAECIVPDGELDAVPCRRAPAPADSFDPDVQWSWMGANGEDQSLATALVANLTDDNDDGRIDLCDTPDVVVVAFADGASLGHIYVLDGATGTEHFRIDTPVEDAGTPAIGDIDADGLPEIVAATPNGNLVAFEHDGSVAWMGPATALANLSGTIALSDIDADGDVEIVTGFFVADHTGNTLFSPGAITWTWAPVAADLDEDGEQEVLWGNETYAADGTFLWGIPGAVLPSFPQVADLDGDGLAEVLITSFDGVSVYEDDGTPVEVNLTPTGAPTDNTAWVRPAAIHDFDGSGTAQFAMSSASEFSVMQLNPAGGIDVTWMATVVDASGVAAGTAFDFLGDGVAEAMYADEERFFVFDGGDGSVLLSGARSSRTLYEYPVVADVDNDGSAEIVVTSNDGFDGNTAPTVQVISDENDRWIQARRIWNQHTYHVTNVREDATIPQNEPLHWKTLNTFRTNSQIEGGGVCDPAD